MAEHQHPPWGLLIGPGSIHYKETETILHTGYLHPATWHCLARHYQRLDHTPTMIVATLTQRLTKEAITIATKAVHIITEVKGYSGEPAGRFRPRSILEYLVAAPLTKAQLDDVKEQVVREDGRVRLIP